GSVCGHGQVAAGRRRRSAQVETAFALAGGRAVQAAGDTAAFAIRGRLASPVPEHPRLDGVAATADATARTLLATASRGEDSVFVRGGVDPRAGFRGLGTTKGATGRDGPASSALAAFVLDGASGLRNPGPLLPGHVA